MSGLLAAHLFFELLSDYFNYLLFIDVISFCKVLDANEHACKLFECGYSDLIGQKLTSLLRANQMLEEVLKEETLDSDGNLVAISAKVV